MTIRINPRATASIPCRRFLLQLPCRSYMFGKNMSFQDPGLALMVPDLYMKSTIFIVFRGYSEYWISGSFMIFRMSSMGLLSLVIRM